MTMAGNHEFAPTADLEMSVQLGHVFVDGMATQTHPARHLLLAVALEQISQCSTKPRRQIVEESPRFADQRFPEMAGDLVMEHPYDATFTGPKPLSVHGA